MYKGGIESGQERWRKDLRVRWERRGYEQFRKSLINGDA